MSSISTYIHCYIHPTDKNGKSGILFWAKQAFDQPYFAYKLHEQSLVSLQNSYTYILQPKTTFLSVGMYYMF